jgi:uncharacterized protein with HEPN domain
MSKRDSKISLTQMRDHAREVLDLTLNKSRADLDSNRVLSLALIRLLEIIGEAANRIPAEERALITTIPWFQIISLRNRLIHSYDQVDLDILWEVVSKDLKPLIDQLDQLLPK